MATKMRLATLAAALVVAALIGAGSLSLTGKADRASADNVNGQFGLATESANLLVEVGNQFTVDTVIYVADQVPYQAVQFEVDYNQAVVSYVSGGADGSAPGDCSLAPPADNGDTTLAGCINLGGDVLTYAGATHNLTYQCDTVGVSKFDLANGVGLGTTFVTKGGGNAPTHLHEVTVTCVVTTDVSAVKTGTAITVAGGVINYDVVGTNNGPLPWTGVVVADDLPDDIPGLVFPPALSVDVDADGDTVAEIVGALCAPGYFPAFPNPFPPPAFLDNVVACSGDLIGVPSIAVGGSMTVHIGLTADADSCNKALVDAGFAASTDDFGGTAIPDPDFLDGVDQTENNFSGIATFIGDCNISITKDGPAAGAVGDVGQYTITLNNAGPSNATNVVVTDNVSANLTVTAVSAGCVNVANAVTCNFASLPPGPTVITIDFTMDDPGLVCNDATVSWTRNDNVFIPGVETGGPKTSTETCFTMIPPYNGIVKGVDTDGDTVIDLTPAQGEDTILVNLWLCTDESDDGIDNDGNSTVDDEAPTCTNNGEGDLDIGELIFSSADCDTRNDDDDGDGKPVDWANDRPECPQPTLEDYNLGLVDKDGGELPEGLGAFEFQLKFDHKIFDITIEEVTVWANGRNVNCTMTIITENDIRFGCVTTGAGLGFGQVSGVLAATIHVSPEADLIYRIRPTKDNGVVRRLLDENCEIADIYGDIFPDTNAGLTNDCTDIDITVRRLEGDVNSDCNVDVEDAQLIAFRYGSFFGHLVYNQNYDLEPWPTADFDIDIKDLQFVFGRDGSTCADPIPDQQWPQAASGVGQP